MTEEQVPIQEAMKRLVDFNKDSTSKITKLEAQIDEICKGFEEYKEQNTSSVRQDVQNMSEKIEAIQAANVTFQQETNSRLEEIKLHWNTMYTDMKTDMTAILLKLGEKPKEEDEEEKSDFQEKDKTPSDNDNPRRHFQFTDPKEEDTIRRRLLRPSYLADANLFTTHTLGQVKHSIIVPPASAAPAFYGKNTESPTQFLIRVQEYAESVHAWDRTTLVNGISQFLRDSALEWYCQLRLSHRRPNTWTEFTDLFLAQFNSPVRKARQEHEWHECKQKENETINEFLVRLRALWREQKPKESERDLVKHLFCRMRNDLLNMIGISRNASLDEVITEVQQIEDILYRRAKGERLAKQIKQTPPSKVETPSNKRYNEENMRRTTPWRNEEDPYNSYTKRTRYHQVNEITPRYNNTNKNHTTTELNQTQQTEPYNCFRCGQYGHVARYCPMGYRTYQQTQDQLNSKNVSGALGERSSYAPM